MLYTFYLILHLLASQHCALWVGSLPTSADVAAACGQIDFAQYEIVVQDLVTGDEVCRPDDVYTLNGCHLDQRLDNYRIVIMQPARDVLACAVTLEHEQPTRADLTDACPAWALAEYDAGRGEIQFAKSEPIPQPAPLCPKAQINSGPGLYDQPASAAELATDEPLTLLAGRLIWHGIVRPNCPGGYSGIDSTTLSADGCGMAAARKDVTIWQNRFDEAIYQAAVAEGVPARLLKYLLMSETQFWTLPTPGADGELGAFQVTDNGLDTLMRYTDPTYGGLTVERQFYIRAQVRDSLACDYCNIGQADAHLRANMHIYARLLASYRCQVNGDWQSAAVAWNEIYSEKLQ
jgi:hypothetical protein